MSPNSSRLLLLIRFLIFTLPAIWSTTACKAQDKFELYGGYSYFRASVREAQFSTCTIACPVQPGPLVIDVSQNANLNGWEFSGQYKLLPFLGVVADFNGTYGTLHSANTREHTLLFGPQISRPAKVSPFAHALLGVAKESQDRIPLPPAPCPIGITACSGFSSLGSDTSFASAVGAGLDVKAIPFVSVRLFQMDYVRTQLHGATQNQPRISAGVAFHF